MADPTAKFPLGMSFVEGNVAANWKRFKQRLTFYFKGMVTTRLSDQKKVGMLMTALGDQGIDVYNTFKNIDEESSFQEVMDAFEEYCNPRRNTVYERFLFSQIVQQTKNVDTFLVELKNQASKCEFGDEEDNLVRDRLVVGIRNPVVRKELLRDAELTLQSAIEIARAWERSETEALAMASSKPSEPRIFSDPLALDRLYQQTSQSPKISCAQCSYEHPPNKCPATDRECNYCKKKGHFAMVCKKRAFRANQQPEKVEMVHEEMGLAVSDEPAENIQVLHICRLSNASNNSCYLSLRIGEQFVKFKIDTGAECNVLSYSSFQALSPTPVLRPSLTRLRAYGAANLIAPIGEITVNCVVNNVSYSLSFVVVKCDSVSNVPIDNLIGLPSIKRCGLVKRLCGVETNGQTDGAPAHPLLQEFSDVFSGLGKAPGQVQLYVQPDAIPVIDKPRRFPFALRGRLCDELRSLANQGVIQKVEEPTDWVSNLIVVKKPSGDLRICLDPKNLNAALRIPKFEIPRPDDILTQLGGCRYFTVLDLRNGFWQLELTDASSLLTTFNSPIGRYRFLRLCFGVSSAPETFMCAMVKFFGDLPGVCPYFDDLIIAGVTLEEHDRNLRNLLVRAREYNFRFNLEKAQFCRQSVNFLGFSISERGVEPQSKHVRAILDMPKPVDRKGVLRLLGMAKYLGRFIPNLSAHTENLRDLTKKNREFLWNSEHSDEFSMLKSLIVRASNLKIYDPTLPLHIQTDSSKSGVGCCMYQNQAPIAYASRALTATEIRYAQIEKELLAVVFALEKFNDYTYGREVVVVTDHRPLVNLVKKHISDVTPRLQRLCLRLMRYSFQLVYKPGKELLVVDALSRAYLTDEIADESYQQLDVHASERVIASPDNYQKLVEETAKDPLLSVLKIYLRGGWPKSGKRYTPALKKCKSFANRLSFRDKLCFFDNRLFVPSSSISLVLEKLHKGHLNVQKTQRLASQTVFWLNMSKDIEKFVGSCSTCLKFCRNNLKEKIRSYPLCTRPWERLHTDIFSLDSQDFLVIYDAYSYWLEIVKLRTKQAAEIVTILQSLFSRFGVPSHIVSDNVPYNSAEYIAFAKEWSFTPIFTSPRYPQSNGLSEKAVAIAKSLVKKNPNDLCLAMLQYRNSPIPHIGYSPAQLLMGRVLNSNLPLTESQLDPKIPDKNVVYSKKLQQQSSTEFYYNRGARDMQPLNPGDKVIYKQSLADSEWRNGSVVTFSQNPRSYVVRDDQTGGTYLRNRRFIVKPLRFRN